MNPRSLSGHTLPNGLRVVVMEDPACPVVAVSMWVHAGGKHETDRTSGSSHYLEHLTSRGTTRRKPLQDRLDIFYVGGLNSANTYYDRTTYFNLVPKEHFGLALDVMADVMQNAVLPEKGLECERLVVSEELRRYHDNPDTAAYRTLFGRAFAPHPYARPVIGTFESVGGLTRADFQQYYRQMYTPGRMVLSICGDVLASEILPQIAAAFQGFAPREVPPANLELPRGFRGFQEQTLRLDQARAAVHLGFVVPGWRHPDRWALEALGRVMGGGASSRLWQQMVQERKLALDAAADNHTLEDLGLFYLACSALHPNEVWELQTGMASVIQEIRDRGIEAQELERVQQQARLLEVFGREDVLRTAEHLGESELYGGTRYFTEARDRLCALTPGDLQDVARRYLVAENLTVVRTVPADTPEAPAADLEAASHAVRFLTGGSTAPTWLNWSAVLPALPPGPVPAPNLASTGAAGTGFPHLGAKGSPRDPETARFVLPNGLTVLFRQRRGKGLVALSVHSRAGARFDPPGQDGLAQLASRVSLKGAGDLNQRDIVQKLEEWGGSYSLGVDRDLLAGRILLSCDHCLAGSALLAEILIHPRFDPQEVEQERARQLVRIERQRDSIQEVAWNAYQAQAFHDSPYGKPILGTAAGLGACGAASVAEFWRRHVCPERSVLTIVGDLSAPEVESLIERSLWQAWPEPATPLIDSPVPPPVPRAGEFEERLDKSQVQVIVGAPGVALSHPDYLSLRTLAHLVGFRCFVDLVYGKSLAYSTGGTLIALMEAGSLALHLGSAAYNADLVVSELRAKWQQVVDTPVSPEELGRVQTRILGGQTLADQRVSHVASSYGYYEAVGLGHDFYDRQREALRALTPTALHEAAQRYLKPEGLLTVRVGPKTQAQNEI